MSNSPKRPAGSLSFMATDAEREAGEALSPARDWREVPRPSVRLGYVDFAAAARGEIKVGADGIVESVGGRTLCREPHCDCADGADGPHFATERESIYGTETEYDAPERADRDPKPEHDCQDWHFAAGCADCVRGFVLDSDGVFQACGDCGAFGNCDGCAQAAAVVWVGDALRLFRQIVDGRPNTKAWRRAARVLLPIAPDGAEDSL
jgi:hypothetical protein